MQAYDIISPLVQSGLQQVRLSKDPKEALSRLSSDDLREVNALFLRIIEEHPDAPIALDTSEVESQLTGEPDFSIRLPTFDSNTDKSKIRFLRVKDAIGAGWLSVLGLAVALMTTGPVGATVPTAGVIWACWSNLTTLHRPQDNDAIDAYLTLQRLLTERRLNDDISLPSTLEIIDALKISEARNVPAGLARLLELRLIKVAAWGDASMNPANLKNIWDLHL